MRQVCAEHFEHERYHRFGHVSSMHRSSPLHSIEVGQAKILTVKNAHDYTYGKPPVGLNMVKSSWP